MMITTIRLFSRFVLPGMVVTAALLLASNVPAFWLLAPLSVACWAVLALKSAPDVCPALWILFAVLWAFYCIGRRFFIVWGVAA